MTFDSFWSRAERDPTHAALIEPDGQIVTAGSGLFGGHAVESGVRLWTHPGVAPTMVASPASEAACSTAWTSSVKKGLRTSETSSPMVAVRVVRRDRATWFTR